MTGINEDNITVAKFNYKVRNSADHILTGMVEAATVDEVLERLHEKDLTPISLNELNFDGTVKNQSFFDQLRDGLLKARTNVPYKRVVFFTRQLATMIDAGVPLARALEKLAQGESPRFQKIIRQVANDISLGNTFADSLARHPGAFNHMYVNVVHSGEVTGGLDRVLEQLATYMENISLLRNKVKGAMRYPTFIAGFVTLLVIGIMWKIVPMFTSMYESFGADLPGPTKLLIRISDLIRFNIPWLILLIIALYFAFRAAMTNPQFAKAVHTYILKVPVFGIILLKNMMATFCRTMALLMESGTPILQAIEISGSVVGNKMVAEKLQEVYENLRRGELLSNALEKTKVFPPLVTQLVATGEESGKVDDLLRRAAEFYEQEIRITVDSLASIIEPVLIIILGGIVGSILIALYLPIFNIGKLMAPQ